jgi:hypothetical protein
VECIDIVRVVVDVNEVAQTWGYGFVLGAMAIVIAIPVRALLGFITGVLK